MEEEAELAPQAALIIIIILPKWYQLKPGDDVNSKTGSQTLGIQFLGFHETSAVFKQNEKILD